MKIFIDNDVITKIDDERRTVYKGDDSADIIKIYFKEYPSNWYLTLGAVLPNGRTVGDKYHDGCIITEVIDGITYYYESFTISKANGWNLIEGLTSFTLRKVVTNDLGYAVSKKTIGVFVIRIVDAECIDENILILDGEASNIILNFKNTIEQLQGLITKATTEVGYKVDKSTFDTFVNDTYIKTINSIYENIEKSIDNIDRLQNLVNVVAYVEDLSNIDKSKLKMNDKIIVLEDEDYDFNSTIYVWDGSSLRYFGRFSFEVINSIKQLIPNQASSTNQLADKDFVNSSINTATATFMGTFDSISDLPNEDDGVNANDYAYIDITDELGNRRFDKYKYTIISYNPTKYGWLYEYTLNNSSFTAAQWKAINSGISEDLLNTILEDINSKQDKLDDNTKNINVATLTAKKIGLRYTKPDGTQSTGKWNGNLVPDTDDTYDLGSYDNIWSELYAKELRFTKCSFIHNNKIKITPLIAYNSDGSFVYNDENGYPIISINKLVKKFYLNNYNGESILSQNVGRTVLYDDKKDEILNYDSSNGRVILKSKSIPFIKVMDSNSGLFNITDSELSIIGTDKINIIPNYTNDFDDDVITSNFDRIKIGGSEEVNADEMADIYIAVKPANSSGKIVPFAITKDGRAFYQGYELVNKSYTGNLDNLTTESKENLVSAINEVNGNANTNYKKIQSTNKELADLKEALYGYVLDTAPVGIEDVIPSTINVNETTYNLVDNVRGLVDEVSGNTAKSENLLVLEDVEETTKNGITYSVKNGVININGSVSEAFNIYQAFNEIPIGTYTFNMFGYEYKFQKGIQVAYDKNYVDFIASATDIKTMTLSSKINMFTIGFQLEEVFNNVSFKPMLVSGQTAPTEFKRGYDGLKSVEYEGLEVLGENLLNLEDIEETTKNGITYSVKNGLLYINGSTTSNTTIYINLSKQIEIKSYGYSSFSGIEDTLNTQWYLTNNFESMSTNGRSNNPFIQNSKSRTNIIMTNSINNTYTQIYIFIANNITFNNLVFKPMLVKGSIAPTSYTPYKEPIILLPFNTKLRGINDVKDKIVVIKNEDDDYYTATKINYIGEVDLGTLNYTINLSNTAFNVDVNIGCKPTPNDYTIPNLLVDRYETNVNHNVYTGNVNKSISVNQNGYIRICDTSYTDAATFKTAMDGIMLQYELAEPTTEVLRTNLIEDEVMPLLQLGGSVEVINQNSEIVNGTSTFEMVYKLSNSINNTEVSSNE
ncbi:MAG: hypothetical protein ACI35S_05255 [Anaeroplasma sp.]